MEPVYFVSAGISKFVKAQKELTFQGIIKEAFDYAWNDIGLSARDGIRLTECSVASYFSDHFTRQLMAGIMAQDYLGLCPLSSHRVEGGGATGGLCFQEAYKQIASGYKDICVAFGFETMSHVLTWKGNEFIALASDTNFDFPVGGFYSGYYAMMVTRHMKEFGTTVEQMAKVSVKNHRNASFNPYAQHGGDVALTFEKNGPKVKAREMTIQDVRNSAMVAWPLTKLDICTMSDGASVCILANEEGIRKLRNAGASISSVVEVIGIGRGTDAMRMVDRPHVSFALFMDRYALEYEKNNKDTVDYYRELWMKGTRYPGVHSFRAGRVAAMEAYEHAKIRNPRLTMDFVEVHDAYTSSEIQTCEDLGFCLYGEGGVFVDSGVPFVRSVAYGDEIEKKFTLQKGGLVVNASGGLLSCGHPVGGTGLLQATFALWQLQGSIEKHLGNATLQIPNAHTGGIHSHAGTGTYVTYTILRRRQG